MSETAVSTVIKMTDKTPTKIVVCAHPGCEQKLEVTKFATPSKQRCPTHKKSKAPPSRSYLEDPKEITARIDAAIATTRALPPHIPKSDALMELRCPFDGCSLEILAISETFGEIVFGCPECQVGISMTAWWRVMQIKRIPEDLREIVKVFNEKQQAIAAKDNAFDKLEEAPDGSEIS